MPELTAAQKNAINEQSKTLLVSAAAGSGKTFTLVERVLRSVVREESPIPLNRLLVVTFTKDTADDLKQRISAAVSEAIAKNGKNEHLVNQISLLPSAKFSTIDSFYLSLVRSNYATLGLSPSFRIADTGEADLLEREVIEELINRCYDDAESTICGGPRGFANLVDTIVGSGSDQKLSDVLLSLYKTLNSYPRGSLAMYDTSKELNEYAKGEFFDCPYGERIKTYISDMFAHYKNVYRCAIDTMACDSKLAATYCITFEDDFKQILKVTSAIDEGYASSSSAIADMCFSTLKSYKGERLPMALHFKEMRDDFKDEVKRVKEKYIFADSEVIKRNILICADVCRALGDFLTEYEKMLEAEKRRKNLCTFSDLSRYSLKLLVDENGNDTPFADEQKKLYDAVYIDEYQDVNAVQNRIFEAISTKTNRFMVGDIKQSIYAFRGAEPAIFSALRFEYPDIDDAKGSDSAAIFMSRNFRCNKEIIDFTNHICDRLMPIISPDMHYSENDALVYGKTRTSDLSYPVKVVVAEKPAKGSPDEGRNTEADYIASEISRLLREEVKDDGTPITPDDIAILMRAPKTKADVFSDALISRGIPVCAVTDQNLLLQSEVEIVRCFIDAVDNPRRDISLTGALLSPLGNIDCSFLASLRAKNTDCRLITRVREFANSGSGEEKDKLAAFLNRLGNFRRMARYMSAGEFIDAVYADMAIPAVLGGENKIRRANLEKFRQLAYSFSSFAGAKLSMFLRYLRNIEDSTTTLTAAKPSDETGGAVRIMSVHKSKGLEFPVVFYANTHYSGNNKDKGASPLYTNAAGFGMRLRDESGFCTYDTMLRKSVALAKDRADKEEELRMLYVALTRAKERLYMTAMHTSPDSLFEKTRFESGFLSPHLALSKKSHLDLSLLALGGAEMPYVTYETAPHIHKTDAAVEAKEDKFGQVTANEETVKLLEARFSYTYPHVARTRIPAKLSISRLYPDILDDVVFDTSIDEKPLPKATIAPRFIESDENLAAKKGTATHLFMQFFDLEYASLNGADAELERLVKNRFITKEDATLVNIDEVKTFLSSSLFAEMQKAKRIFREQRFNLLLPAEEFASDETLKAHLSGESVLVQGVIDCFFYDENGEIVLVDYKTDRLPKDRDAAIEKLKNAHSRQLSYYARAIEEICERAPEKKIIYSLALGEAIIV